MTTPYRDLPVDEWETTTRRLIDEHPLDADEIVEVTLGAWASILESRLGAGKEIRIGLDLRPKPQIMAFFLHELIPLELSRRHPGVWRGDEAGGEKDLVYIPDVSLSVEIKTSSHPSQIFGNRSYAQQSSSAKKRKSGYYLAINFDKFSPRGAPAIRIIRFGWLDHSDWTGQRAATGQQARLSPDVERFKLLRLYPAE
jgi:hypothetical protein